MWTGIGLEGERMSDKISDKMSDKQNQAIKTGDKQTISKQLAKCPFCGGEAVLLKGKCELDNYVMCLRCFTRTKLYNTKEGSIVAWNTRKPMERILERLEEESFVIEIDYDFDEYDDEPVEAVFLNEAVEIVKEEGGIE